LISLEERSLLETILMHAKAILHGVWWYKFIGESNEKDIGIMKSNKHPEVGGKFVWHEL
jgi:hypothetical protein